MKIAIHKHNGSYSDRWIDYCLNKSIDFKIVNCLSTDIIKTIQDCDVILWHWSHVNIADKLFAYKIIRSMEMAGKLVFPSSYTCWHFDDKAAQKFLLEAIGAPLVPSYLFVNIDDAMQWIGKTEFPKVFKLKSGAGSSNVRLVKNIKEAQSLIKKAFTKGFKSFSGYFSDYKTKIYRTRGRKNFAMKLSRSLDVIKNLNRLKIEHGKQIGYIYFQDYLPNNDYDTRISIIGNRAFGFIRQNRKHDFRASGSGNVCYDLNLIDRRAIEIAFSVADKLRSQSIAFDFIYDNNKDLKICEISYAFVSKFINNCPGFWDNTLAWKPGQIILEDCILEDIILKKGSE